MKKFHEYIQDIQEVAIKRGKMKDIDDYYGAGQARGGTQNPTIYGVAHKGDVVWFRRKSDAQMFIDWPGRRNYNLVGDLGIKMGKDGLYLKSDILSGH